MSLPLLPQDKANHFLYGALVAAPPASLFDPTIALIAVAIVGVGKEVSDWWHNKRGGRHGVEFMDAVATICGGLVVIAPQLIKDLK
jgi:hypothetical protein